MYEQKPIYNSTHLEPRQEGGVTLHQQLKLVSPDLMVPAPQLGLGLRRGGPAVERTLYNMIHGSGWAGLRGTQCNMTPGPWPHLVTSRSQEKGRKVVWPSESSTSSPAPRSATCSSPAL